MSRVYIVQRPAIYDRVKRGWINKYDLTPAQEHGELFFLLRPGNVFKDKLEETVTRLKRDLADFTVEDHLLPVGDPVLIAAAVMAASRSTGGTVSLLKFDRTTNKYEPYLVTLGNEG